MADTRGGSARGHAENGFTLIELLVVILITAILAGIAIPVFLHQRTKAFRSDLISALKAATVAAQAYAVDQGGSYAGLNGDDGTALTPLGYPPTENVYLALSATISDLCVLAHHESLPTSDDWKVATLDTSQGAPSSSDLCVAVPTPPVPGPVEPAPEPTPSTPVEPDPDPEPTPTPDPDDEIIVVPTLTPLPVLTPLPTLPPAPPVPPPVPPVGL